MGRIGDWVAIATAREIIHAHLMAGVLAEAGIEARIGNEHLQAVLGDIPSDLSSRPQILVRMRNVEWAREVLEDLERDVVERRARGGG